MYASYNYYVTRYLRGREPRISETDFNFYAERASDRIDIVTSNRLINIEAPDIPVRVKDCVCAMAEDAFAEAEIATMANTVIAAPAGEHVTVPKARTIAESESAQNRIVQGYLSGMGILGRSI
jgi:hypothetical protein